MCRPSRTPHQKMSLNGLYAFIEKSPRNNEPYQYHTCPDYQRGVFYPSTTPTLREGRIILELAKTAFNSRILNSPMANLTTDLHRLCIRDKLPPSRPLFRPAKAGKGFGKCTRKSSPPVVIAVRKLTCR